MAKIKVHELAKELELQSKDILSFLQEKGIEAKAAQSSLEEDAAALVRNSLGKKKAAAPAAQKAPVNTENAKPAEEKAQAPAGEAKAQETKVSEETKSTEETKKKKKIIFVSNPQNSKMPGQRQGGQSTGSRTSHQAADPSVSHSQRGNGTRQPWTAACEKASDTGTGKGAGSTEYCSRTGTSGSTACTECGTDQTGRQTSER